MNIVFFDIDTQFDFMDSKGSLYLNSADSIKPNLLKLKNFALENNHYIIASTDCHDPEDPEFKHFTPHCIVDTHGSIKIKETELLNPKIIPNKKEEIDIQEHKTFILIKNSLNVFSNPNIESVLKRINPQETIVYGVATDYCIKLIVLELVKRNYSVTLVTDAIKGFDEIESLEFLKQAKTMGVKLKTTEEVLKGSK